jgi:hypothetical protein
VIQRALLWRQRQQHLRVLHSVRAYADVC